MKVYTAIIISNVLTAFLVFFIRPVDVKTEYIETPVYIERPVQKDLYYVAEEKIEDLKNTGFWSHDNSDKTFNQRVAQMDSSIQGDFGENLYNGTSCDIRVAVSAWIDSPTHLEILDMGYDEGVITIDRDQEGQCYIVMNVLKY